MTPERELRAILLDGSEVIMNTGDKVLFQASRPGAIPLSVDADTIIDDVLAALKEAQQDVEEWQEEAKQWRDEFVDKNNTLGEAQQTIARQQAKILVLERDNEMLESIVNSKGAKES
ncbi:hypothetical protein [Paenibacillus wynnii]|uniref:Bacteriophage SP-beta YorD domain-containing protein n=1 Tax=Paenibacillus wynnii TaxID=268407 RepID=A0A098MA84_9BACL|nr:hypothetical protein [Paenibacillus wynnii]KGE18447.1 hypothetical protein PWYN_28535 [Paenibacillus wynnii]KGE20657.1 hypothetical protein PWYN_00160 [Paenibacillus wynnii]